jgi:signal transduction histidine kinase
MTPLPIQSLFRIVVIITGVAIAYFAAGHYLLVLGAPPNGAVITVWFPSGISVAALILFGPVAAIGSFLGSVVLELKNGTPIPASMIVAIANAGSELLCYYMVVGRGEQKFSIAEVRDVLRFVMAAVLVSVLSAIIGVSAYVIFGVVPGSIYWSTWLTWFGSAVIGIVLITPFLVYSVRDLPSLGNRVRYFEYTALIIILSVAAFLWQGPAFGQNLPHEVKDPFLLIIILMLLWTAFRFPPASMTLAVFLFAVSAVFGAVLRLRHEIPGDTFDSIFSLQMMLGGLAVLGFLLDSMVTAQKRSAEALQADIARREEAEKEVRRLNEQLEHEVEERTSQLIEAQEELLRKEKLAILGQLSGSVGHELRNPLGVMSNAVYFLKMVHSEADETTKEYLDIIKYEIDNSLRIITDLLDFARTKTAQLQTVSVRALIDESLGKCTIPKNIELINNLPELMPYLKVDPQQIGQVLHNLIMNAIQAMPAGGLLTFDSRQDNDGMVRLQIDDTGEGISPENMKKLFQPLFTTKAKGIGLGLVVCRNLTEANGGRIEASSEPGRGTTFTVILPVRKPLAEGNSKL